MARDPSTRHPVAKFNECVAPRSGARRTRICYLARLMSTRKFTKRPVATKDLDPAALAERKLRDRLRKRINRTLLKRRRQKSGQ